VWEGMDEDKVAYLFFTPRGLLVGLSKLTCLEIKSQCLIEGDILSYQKNPIFLKKKFLVLMLFRAAQCTAPGG
jgi:hypothetical protein